MSRSALVRVVAVVAFVLSPGASSALTLNVIGLGLDVGNVCLDTAASCSAGADFTLPQLAPITGAFEYTPTGGGSGTMALELDVADFSMTGSGPDGVTELVFSNIHLSVLSWNTFEVGSDIQGLGFASLSVTGTYEQLDAGSGTVVAATSLDQTVQASNLVCPLSGVGQCGLSLAARDFEISIGTTNAATHDVAWTLNVVVPEPATAVLLMSGLLVAGLARRTRS
jgi:hypothetical protein